MGNGERAVLWVLVALGFAFATVPGIVAAGKLIRAEWRARSGSEGQAP